MDTKQKYIMRKKRAYVTGSYIFWQEQFYEINLFPILNFSSCMEIQISVCPDYASTSCRKCQVAVIELPKNQYLDCEHLELQLPIHYFGIWEVYLSLLPKDDDRPPNDGEPRLP